MIKSVHKLKYHCHIVFEVSHVKKCIQYVNGTEMMYVRVHACFYVLVQMLPITFQLFSH